MKYKHFFNADVDKFCCKNSVSLIKKGYLDKGFFCEAEKVRFDNLPEFVSTFLSVQCYEFARYGKGARNNHIIEMVSSGRSMAIDMACVFNISASRVHQIIRNGKKTNLNPHQKMNPRDKRWANA